jgi:acyl-ACP thioesterase
MYSFKSRVRYSEVDKDKKMDMYSIINYFQDCSTFQSEDIGMGLDFLENEKRVWLMNAWQIVADRYPVIGEDITVSTWAYGFNGMYGYRNFIITDSNDKVCTAANSIWVYMDTESYRPAKVTEDVVKGYEIEKAYEMDYAPRKITIPKNLAILDNFPVIRSNIDTNNHVNNGQYIKMAEEFLPGGFPVRQMRAEYRRSAILGDIIVPMVCENADSITVALADTNEKPYAVIEFKK